MKKRMLSILLIASFTFAAVACGKEEANDPTPDTQMSQDVDKDDTDSENVTDTETDTNDAADNNDDTTVVPNQLGPMDTGTATTDVVTANATATDDTKDNTVPTEN